MDGVKIKENEQPHQNEVDRLKALRPDIPEELYDLEASEEMQMQWDEIKAGGF